jgi:hypothetical protein
MKFQIRRTSHGFSQHERPCDHPSLRDETPDDARVGDSDTYEHLWSIEVPGLPELIALATGDVYRRSSRSPSVIVWPSGGELDLPMIEIYDAYRE